MHNHTCACKQVQNDGSLTDARVFMVLFSWKQKWNKALMLNSAALLAHTLKATQVNGFSHAVAGKHFSQTLCSSGLKATGGFPHSALHVRYVAPAHNIQRIWRLQWWNPDSALFPCSCLIFQMPQSHVVGQRAGPHAECRTLSWDLSNDWRPRAACCCVPRLPQADRSRLQRCGAALLQTLVKRDGYFPYARYFHDELFPGIIFLHILYFGVCLFF